MLKTFVLVNGWNTIMSSKTVMGQIGNNLRMCGPAQMKLKVKAYMENDSETTGFWKREIINIFFSFEFTYSTF